MTALKIARAFLLFSMAVYGAAFFLDWLGAIPGAWPFLAGLAATFGMVVGAAACVLLQARNALVRRSKRSSA